SSLASAQQGVITAEAEYLRIIGVAPNNIEAPTKLPELPNSKEEALKIARTENPSFLAARLAEKASKYGVKIASASFLPSVSLSAARTKSKSNPVNAYDTDEQSDSISAMLTIPLFAGGRNKAGLREAKEINAQRKLEIHNASRLLERQLVSAWYELESTKERLRFLKEQVKATKSALDGVVAETEIGLRNISDVLDAEEEVLDSELDLLLVQRDQFIASYTLLAIMGKLTPKRLGLQSPENW
ncbi:MAG: TolC family protein, partial [Parvibaculales bacterium]